MNLSRPKPPQMYIKCSGSYYSSQPKNATLLWSHCVYHGHNERMLLWPFVVVHWQQTFQIISLISGKPEPSLKDPHCSDVCIWRPYHRGGRAGCLCWRIAWDRRCHTTGLTGLLIVPVENKERGRSDSDVSSGPGCNWGACPQKLVCLFTILPGVPAVGGTASSARTRNVLWVRANALWRREYGSWQK